MATKTNYLSCTREGNHSGQQLNIVCLNQACINNSLCCCACIEEFHHGHPTKTLKRIISQGQEIIKKGVTPNQQQDTPISPHALLNIVSQNQAKVVNKFKFLRMSINSTLDQIEQNLNSYFKQLMKVLQNPTKTQDPTLVLSAALLQVQSSQNYNQAVMSLQKLLLQLSRIGQDGKFQAVYKSQQALQKLIRQSNKQVSDITDSKLGQIRNILSQSSNFLFDSITNANNLWSQPLYRFRKQLAHENIVVRDSTTVFAEGDYVYQMALMEPQINMNGSTQIFRFKISELTANWIAVGIAHKNTAQSNNFQFEHSSTGHGAYMISANAGTWHHSKPELNNRVRAFTFKKNDLITCIVDPQRKKIYFVRQATMSQLSSPPRQFYQLPFDTQNDNPLHPCVTIFYSGNLVQYIPPTNISQIPKYDFLFSQNTKHSDIQITNDRAIQIMEGVQQNYRAALLNKSVEDGKWNTIKKFSVKIVNCSSDWIGIGIARSKTVANKNYEFDNYEQTGHGYYMISSNGGTWSNHDSEVNNSIKGIIFKTGDIIQCSVQLGQSFDSINHRIIFKRGRDKYILPFKCMANDKLYPCVMLYYIEDEVSILPSF